MDRYGRRASLRHFRTSGPLPAKVFATLSDDGTFELIQFPPSGGGESSTEAERDRSLRDQVVEAMREGDRDGFDEDTKRYYEELLR